MPSHTNRTVGFNIALILLWGMPIMSWAQSGPSSETVRYGYDSSGRLSTITHSDNSTRSYVYENSSFPNAVTGIVDESNNRYATWAYDGEGRATSGTLAGGAESASLVYNSNGTVTVTDALGAQRTFTFGRYGDLNLVTGISGSQCPTCSVAQAATYDEAGFPSSSTDYNGNVTEYTYDDTRGLELSRTEAYGTSQARTITTAWNSTWHEPSLITEPDRTTSFTYDSMGNALTKTVTDTTVTPNASRTWTYTYDSFGRVLTAQDSRTDLSSTTTYTYYTCTTSGACGQLQSTTDPVGHQTTFSSYSSLGQLLTSADPNGAATNFFYDARQRLTSRVDGSETTTYAYYPTSLLEQVTLPDSSYVQYTYDAAHRLTKLNDGAGNSVQYTLDAEGNRTAVNTYDSSDTMHFTHTRTYNTLGQLHQDISAAGNSAVTTTYSYDANGNQTAIAAPLSRNEADAYDPLNRLNQITDPASGVTTLTYDAENDLTSVQDPRNLTTSYSYDGFGDLTQLVSPDTGTSTNTYDSGGNLSVATDARAATANYSYDAANRVSSIIYKSGGGVTDQTIAFGYDSGTYGKGHLTSAGDGNDTLSWSYDAQGRVVGKGITVGSVVLSVGYGYTNAVLTAMTTPSGQAITYSYNSNHQVAGISVNGNSVLASVTYEPFGGVNGWIWSDGSTASRTYNGDGLISQIVTAGTTLGYSYDNANRISGITDSSNSALSWTYGYDALDRLTSAATSANTYGWTYDADGNRLTQTGTSATTFTVSNGSNQLSSTSGTLSRAYTYDAAGHATGYGSLTFGYNNRGRMASTSGSSMSYLYNALGQLVQKSNSGSTTILAYDEAGHLIGEYDGGGNLIEETVYLGDIPVANLRPNGSGGINIFYIHTYHLNTPKKISQPTTGTLAWRWDTDPFGTAAPNQNPGGLGTFVYNQRFPGQYYQAETSLNYNYFRDYDPQVGGYIESDPTGLNGGINTYAYVLDPISYVDPTGLAGGMGEDTITQHILALIREGRLDELQDLLNSEGLNSDQTALVERGLTRAGDLIRGGLKRSASYHKELEDKSYAEICRIARGSGEEAKRAQQMRKLIEQAKRLAGKGY